MDPLLWTHERGPVNAGAHAQERRRHSPQRSRPRHPDRTVTTSAPVFASSLTPSTTAPARPSLFGHSRHWRTARRPLLISAFHHAEIVGILGGASLIHPLKLPTGTSMDAHFPAGL
jgi:hypothetical protein